MAAATFISILAFAIFSTNTVPVLGMGMKQEIVLYATAQDSANMSESSPHKVFTENLRNVTSELESSSAGMVGKFSNATSACTNGTWMVYPEANFSAGGILLSAINATSNTISNVCHNITGNGTSIKSVRHAGHTDLSVSALSLYNNELMAAGQELYFEGYRLVLPYPVPMSVGSYGFTGPKPWCVSAVRIPDGDATSNACTCLALPKSDNQAQFNSTGGNILTYNEKIEDLKVQEIRAGCSGGETQPKIQPDYTINPFIIGNGTNMTMPTPAMMTMNSSGIQLVLKIKGTGNASSNGTLTLIGTKLRLMEPLLLLNYSFTGMPAANWTVYSDIYGTTGARCLIHGTTRNANTSAAAEQIQVGAIALGCDMKSGAGASGLTAAASIRQFTATVLMILLTYALY